MPQSKKVGSLPVAGDTDTVKQTNEISMAIPLLQTVAIEGKDISADALHTQRKLAAYLVARGAHYHFTLKANWPRLLADIELYFRHRQAPDFLTTGAEHGRIETRRIWVTSTLNHYLDFPHLGQAFLIEREVFHKKSGKHSTELAYGITSRPSHQASPERLLQINRGHWVIENSCHYILDWNYDEDRCRIRTGHGPENISRLRRFAIGVIKSRGVRSVAQTIRRLAGSPRLVLDYLKMTENAQPSSLPRPGGQP